MTTHTNNPTRIEADSIGQHAVPVDAYYGVQSLRARENFPITGQSLHPRFIQSLAYVKKACAITNQTCHRLSEDVAQAIVQPVMRSSITNSKMPLLLIRFKVEQEPL